MEVDIPGPVACGGTASARSWDPSDQYRKVAEANRVFYAQNAATYDESETCVTDRKAQATLERDLDRVLEAIDKPASEVQALDACGGSGNISLKLLGRGVDATLADISPELQQIFREKCAAHDYRPKVVCSEIGSFLTSTPDSYDLIVFSSALHHLENIEEVLTHAFGRLNSGGVLFAVFDPTPSARNSRLTRWAQRLEYLCFKLLHQTSDLPKAVIRRLRRLLSGSHADDKLHVDLDASTAGVLAEYHVEKGIDDLALVERMGRVGFEVVWHERYAGARFALTARLIRWVGDVTSFKLLLRRP